MWVFVLIMLILVAVAQYPLGKGHPAQTRRNVICKERIGYIGLGIMGLPMAPNLLKAGYPLTVFSRTKSKADDAAQSRRTLGR